MALQTRSITVTIFKMNGDPLVGARVEIRLVGMGNGVAGAVAPELTEKLTNGNGQCVFELWQNEQELSDTEYEIRSYHPATGRKIHNGETFRVYDSDADVEDLLNIAPVRIDPNAELLEKMIAARAGAEQAAANAAAILAQVQALYDAIEWGDPGQGGEPPVAPNFAVNAVQGIARIIYLGPATNDDGAITYVSSSAYLQVSGNMGVYLSNIVGEHTALITVSDANGRSAIGTILITNHASSSVTDYQMSGVQVGPSVTEYLLPGVQVVAA